VVRRRFTDEEKERIWDMHQAGIPVKRIARRMRRQNVSLRKLISGSGGIRPRARVVNERHLSHTEREEISRGLADGLSFRAIAEGLGRAPSTIFREVNANGGRRHHRALVADAAARKRTRRPKVAELARCRRLRAKVEAKLAVNWSPDEISGWLARSYPNRSRANTRRSRDGAGVCGSSSPSLQPNSQHVFRFSHPGFAHLLGHWVA
jgi:IS30 family transposase